MLGDISRALSREFLGNPLQAYVSALLTFTLALIGICLLRKAVLARLNVSADRQQLAWHEFLLGSLGRIRISEYALFAFYLATHSLALGAGLSKVIHIVFVVALSLRSVTLLQGVIGYALGQILAGNAGDLETTATRKNLRHLADFILWAVAVVFVLENLGINITTAVTGLGIGGIAVAMAAQQILGDLFSSFVIYMDRPFSIGDDISVGDASGTVEYVGVKTTRLRSSTGELLVFPNSALTSTRLRNFKNMSRRSVVFTFRIAYETAPEKARAIPEMIRSVIMGIKQAAFDRAHLKSFAATGLEFEVAYAVLGPDYNLYMDIQQQVNLAIMERLRAEGIVFARAAQSVL